MEEEEWEKLGMMDAIIEKPLASSSISISIIIGILIIERCGRIPCEEDTLLRPRPAAMTPAVVHSSICKDIGP